MSTLETAVGAASLIIEEQYKLHRARDEMRNILVQADCLRYYSKLTDSREHKIGPTLGEIQAGHFEDIAVRAFPDLQELLDTLRTAREEKNG